MAYVFMAYIVMAWAYVLVAAVCSVTIDADGPYSYYILYSYGLYSYGLGLCSYGCYM